MLLAHRIKLTSWLAPAFLISLGIIFVLAPWSLKDKLDAICFGI